jgi:hypothetical protein
MLFSFHAQFLCYHMYRACSPAPTDIAHPTLLLLNQAPPFAYESRSCFHLAFRTVG